MSATHIKECPVPTGKLLIIGGKENKGNADLENREAPEQFNPLEILKRFVELIAKEHPVVEIITTASSEGEDSYREYKQLFEKLGIQNPGHIHHCKRAEIVNDDSCDRVKNADAFSFQEVTSYCLHQYMAELHF